MLIYILEHVLIFGVCFFAWRFGALPEKIAGAWLAGNVTAFAIAIALGRQSPMISLVFDGIFSIGLLPLAMFFVSWSVGVMCLIQTGSFAVQAFYLLNDKPADAAFSALTTTAVNGLVVALFISTLLSLRSRGSLGGLARG